jgi:hypothetical protein
MMRTWPVVSLLAVTSIALGGCVAGMAVGAAGMAARAVQGKPRSNAELKPAASQACSAQAGQYGTVHVIDVEQRSVNKLVVWGTVDDGKQRRSFECSYGTKITGFRLRPIKAQ